MARARDPNRDKAKEMYIASGGLMLLKDIAEQLGKGEGTVRGWKKKDDWDGELNGTLQSNEKNAPLENMERSDETKSSESVDNSPTKKDGRVKRASGNPNPKNQFTKRNRAAMIHGLRSKFFFDEQIEIMEALQEFDVVDQLWLQIEISFSAIVRAQKIMWVDDPFDHLKEVSLRGESTGYKVVYAHERYESYIKAQTRAFAEHRSLVKQFMDLTTEDDERRLKLEQMQLNIDKTKAEIEKLGKDSKVTTNDIIIVDEWSAGDETDD